jgi:hypothetical protein
LQVDAILKLINKIKHDLVVENIFKKTLFVEFCALELPFIFNHDYDKEIKFINNNLNSNDNNNNNNINNNNENNNNNRNNINQNNILTKKSFENKISNSNNDDSNFINNKNTTKETKNIESIDCFNENKNVKNNIENIDINVIFCGDLNSSPCTSTIDFILKFFFFFFCIK